MATRPRLHLVGYWCETRAAPERVERARARALAELFARQPELADTKPIAYPHPRLLRSVQPIPDAPRICEYLRRGSTVRRQMGYSYCRFEGGPPDEEMGSRELSDGVWVWPEGLAVYVERYSVQLPEEFIEHMRAHGFVPRPCALDFEDVDYSVEKWLAWTRRFADVEARVAMLTSDDADVVLDALFELGGSESHEPPLEVLEVARRLFRHEDPDVRRQAVLAVGLHWQFAPAFADLLTLLEDEKDEDVADAVMSAIAAMGRSDPALRPAALAALRRRLRRSVESKRLQGVAYLEARYMCGEVTAQEYARTCLKPELVSVEEAWFDRHR